MSIYYTFITEPCTTDTRRHNMEEEVRAFAQKLEAEQNTQSLERFPPPYLKKRFGKQGRLIIEEHIVGEFIVLCLVRYLIRSSGDYARFLESPESFQQNHVMTPEEIERFLESRRSQPPIAPLAPPNEVETQYLQALSGMYYTDEGGVLESYEWYERVSQPWVTDYLPRYYDLVYQMVTAPEKKVALLTNPKNPRIKILCRHFPEYKKFFLIAQINPDLASDEATVRMRYAEILDVHREVSKETLLRHSRRAYPAILASDEGIWINIQKSEVANLALSPEEEEILESIQGASNNKKRYPLFINGRPGSGKSTILQYLFAGHLAHHLSLPPGNRLAQPPLYLTYSEGLLAQAKGAVKNILQCSGEVWLHNTLPDLQEEASQKELDKAFQNFRSFLLDLLPVEKRSKFAADRYVDFNTFKQRWEPRRAQHPQRDVRRISSELSWHAIRTYIKGMLHGGEGEIDPEYYSTELPRNRRSLTTTTFSNIYTHVWERWYQPLCENDGHWDDQDLARAVLEASLDLSHYPVIFCDEAQDFTVIELELIQRLSLFSRKQILPYRAKDVPFAFAGDPFQTLNPTGFHWDSIQASFHDNIVRQLDMDGQARLQFNFQELTFNYRSTEQIVKFGNLIQLLRGVALGTKDLSPQQTWSMMESVSPFCFLQNDMGWKKAVREQDELVIIVPCQEGGEREFIEQDSFLKEIALQGEEVGRNILSPARAKGLEYNRVLLYRFGDHALQQPQFRGLMQRIAEPSAAIPDSEERLLLEYFLNQLYVAASRARRRLFVVDSEEGHNQFWQFTTPEARRDLLALYDSESSWSPDVLGGMMAGDDQSWSEDRDNPLQLAERFEQQGRMEKDPYLLDRARHNYLRAGRREKAVLCEASALEFEEKYHEAGNRFVEFGNWAEACRCFWAGQEFRAILSLRQRFPEVAQDLRYLAAQFLESQNPTWIQATELLEQLSAITSRALGISPGELLAWNQFVEQLIEGLRTSAVQPMKSADQVDQAVQGLRRLLDHLGLPLRRHVGIAELLYRAGHPHEAIEHWQATAKDKKEEPNWLIRAQADQEPYPDNLRYLVRLKDDAGLVEAWRQASEDHGKEGEWTHHILASARRINDWDAILGLIHHVDSIEDSLDTLKCALQEEYQDFLAHFPVAFLPLLAKKGEWQHFIRFAERQETGNNECDHLLRHNNMRWDTDSLRGMAIRVLARSEELSQEETKAQQAISEFLHRYLVVKREETQRQHVQILHKKYLSVVEGGAALERANKLTYALDYYEQWFTEPQFQNKVFRATKAELQHVRTRWVVCKEHLAEVTSSAQSDKHLQEAADNARRWRLLGSTNHGANHQEMPKLEPLTGTVSLVDEDKLKPTPAPSRRDVNVSLTMELEERRLQGQLQRHKHRIVLIDQRNHDQVICGPERVYSEDLAIVGDGAGQWQIAAWNLNCELERYGESVRIRFFDPDSKELYFGTEL